MIKKVRLLKTSLNFSPEKSESISNFPYLKYLKAFVEPEIDDDDIYSREQYPHITEVLRPPMGFRYVPNNGDSEVGTR